MIGGLLTDLAGSGTPADMVRSYDETLTATVDPDGGEVVDEGSDDAIQVRVSDQGRIGWAGGDTSSARAVVDAAARSAAAADPAPLLFPAPSALPEVAVRSPAAAAAGPTTLLELARNLADRLGRRGRRVETWAERSLGGVEVGNTRGVLAGYPVTLMGIGATVWPADQPDRPARDSRVAAVVSAGEVESLVEAFEERLSHPVEIADGGLASTTVWFAPRAVRALLTPVLAGLQGEQWLAGRDRWPLLDRRLRLSDDPLVDGRPGSRPICDDGVPCRRLTLIENGRAVAGIVDLRTGSRHGLPATGHAWRRGGAAPRLGFSNLRMAAGEVRPEELARTVGTGIKVADLEFGPAPNPATGVFQVEVPWAYRVVGGEITSRLVGLVLMGNVFELLNRVVAVGADPTWVGAMEVPSLVLDGVGVGVR